MLSEPFLRLEQKPHQAIYATAYELGKVFRADPKNNAYDIPDFNFKGGKGLLKKAQWEWRLAQIDSEKKRLNADYLSFAKICTEYGMLQRDKTKLKINYLDAEAKCLTYKILRRQCSVQFDTLDDYNKSIEAIEVKIQKELKQKLTLYQNKLERIKGDSSISETHTLFEESQQEQAKKAAYAEKRKKVELARVEAIQHFLKKIDPEISITLSEISSDKKKFQQFFFECWKAWKDTPYELERNFAQSATSSNKSSAGFSAEDRKNIHAGLLILFFSYAQSQHHDTNTTQDPEALRTVFQTYLKAQSNKAGTAQKSFVEGYHQAQDVLAKRPTWLKTPSGFFDKLLGIFYAIMSGIVKGIGTASFILFGLGLAPPAWVGFPFFLLLVALMLFQFYEPGGKYNALRALLGTLFLIAITMLMFCFPAGPWFYFSVGLLIGSFVGMQSWLIVKNIYRKYNNASNAVRRGHFDFLNKKTVKGVCIEMNFWEKIIVRVVCIPLSILNQLLFQCLLFGNIFYFVTHASFMASVASIPGIAGIIFVMIFLMQCVSILTNFRFTVDKFLSLLEIPLSIRCASIRNFCQNCRYHFVKKPCAFVFKSISILVLSLIAFEYMYLGAIVGTKTTLAFLVTYCGVHLAAGSIIPGMIAVLCFFVLILPVQFFYSRTTNIRLFNMICDTVANWWDKPQRSDLILLIQKSYEQIHRLMYRKHIFTAISSIIGKTILKFMPNDPYNFAYMITDFICACSGAMLGLWEKPPSNRLQQDEKLIKSVSLITHLNELNPGETGSATQVNDVEGVTPNTGCPSLYL